MSFISALVLPGICLFIFLVQEKDGVCGDGNTCLKSSVSSFASFFLLDFTQFLRFYGRSERPLLSLATVEMLLQKFVLVFNALLIINIFFAQ